MSLHSDHTRTYILITGGAGFIGSHTAVELAQNGYNLIIIDTLDNSSYSVIEHIHTLTSSSNSDIQFYQIDYGNKDELNSIFSRFSISAVIHFAAHKCVPESIQKPLTYYSNNVAKTITLLQVMADHGCKRILFSSSATVYGIHASSPIKESANTGNGITNPYGNTKFVIERILADLSTSDPAWSITCLRYFNPIGAHPSGLIGENPNGIPNNIFPYILRVAVGLYPSLPIYGNNYETYDGTCVRDFIHVVDLARAHQSALAASYYDFGFKVYNVGTGKGTSVKTLIHAFETSCNCTIHHKYTDRRPGDVAVLYADNQKIVNELGWTPEFSLEDMCRSGYAFALRNLHPQ
jgi:UDP-glucose 4-epimerase